MTGRRHPGDAAAGPLLHLHLSAGDTHNTQRFDACCGSSCFKNMTLFLEANFLHKKKGRNHFI